MLHCKATPKGGGGGNGQLFFTAWASVWAGSDASNLLFVYRSPLEAARPDACVPRSLSSGFALHSIDAAPLYQ